MFNLTNKEIVNAYKKPKSKHVIKHYKRNEYMEYMFLASILLLFCAPTLAFGIIKGRFITTIIASSMIAIVGSLGLSIVAIMPSLGSDNPHYNRPGTNETIVSMLLCSYGLQFAINLIVL
jgi:Cu/Ag efflux pump CusA